MAILEVQDIHTYYGDAYVLQGLSLQVEQGQILGLLGRNGVGKTTLVNSSVFKVDLEPGCGQKLVLEMKRYTNTPTAKHPWQR